MLQKLYAKKRPGEGKWKKHYVSQKKYYQGQSNHATLEDLKYQSTLPSFDGMTTSSVLDRS
jgi:hypothetical protein